MTTARGSPHPSCSPMGAAPCVPQGLEETPAWGWGLRPAVVLAFLVVRLSPASSHGMPHPCRRDPPSQGNRGELGGLAGAPQEPLPVSGMINIYGW